MLTVPPASLPLLGPLVGPERPGPMIFAHVAATGCGRCRADRLPDPRVAVAELHGDNVALRGDPDAMGATDLAGVRGLVEAPPEWRAALLEVDPGLVEWERVVATLPAAAEPDPPRADVRRLGPSDAAALTGLSPEIAWIHATWGVAGALAAEVAHAAFVDGRAVSVAIPFFSGRRYEDIGVVTEEGFRGRALSMACAAAVVADVRARGRVPSWTTSPDNAGSLAVAAKLGFVHERDDVLYLVRASVPS